MQIQGPSAILFSKMDFLTQIPVLECSRSISNHLPSDTLPPPHLQLPCDIGEKHVTFTDVIPSGPCLEVKTDCVSRETPTLRKHMGISTAKIILRHTQSHHPRHHTSYQSYHLPTCHYLNISKCDPLLLPHWSFSNS